MQSSKDAKEIRPCLIKAQHYKAKEKVRIAFMFLTILGIITGE